MFTQFEELGFCGRGEAKDFATVERLSLGGELPINTNGGLLGEAYIHGMNGITEGVRQIRGTSHNQAAVLLRECVDFLAPHLAAAKLTGEVRKDLDVGASGEWFARILFSLFSTPSSTFDMNDPDVVADFVRAHVVQGFASDRARPRRGA